MNKIRELRIKNGWRQEDLAVRMNTKRQTIGHYETGERGLDVETINRLCDIFGCTADYLLGRSMLPSAELTEEEADMLLAFRAADPNIRAGIKALLAPYTQKEATTAS